MEMKMRAWDGAKMIYWDFSGYKSENEHVWGWDTGEVFVYNEGIGEITWIESDGSINLDLNIMVWTGRDNIYEDDIVQVTSISVPNYVGKVVFSKSAFWIKGQEGQGDLLHVPLKVQVIGNIYENAGLI